MLYYLQNARCTICLLKIFVLALFFFKQYCIVFQVSPDGKQFSVTSPDRRIRVFWFRTGKLRRVYDESLEVIVFSKVRQGFIRFCTIHKINELYFGRSLKISKEVTIRYTGWKPLILVEEWLLREKLRRQKALPIQMQFLMRVLIFLYMQPCLG